MAYIPPPEPGAPTSAAVSLGSVIAMGSAAALAGAFAVGLLSGLTGIQSAYVSILLGWVVGLAIRRSRRDSPAAIGAGIIALTGSATATVIALTVRIVTVAHVPLAVVLTHMPKVISAVPHVIGWFGFVCWALAAYASWMTTADRGRRPSPILRPARPATAPGGPGQPYGTPPEPGQESGASGLPPLARVAIRRPVGQLSRFRLSTVCPG